jgi:hypothetical protein
MQQYRNCVSTLAVCRHHFCAYSVSGSGNFRRVGIRCLGGLGNQGARSTNCTADIFLLVVLVFNALKLMHTLI